MAATSIPDRWKYDVFVSFRGEDIRKNFMDHMFNDFKQKRIHAFRDDRELPEGEYISPHLYKAIQESRFLIVIFSKNYASSSWCLRELVKILECKQMGKPKHEVQIIFYDVSNSREVDKWREALSMAATNPQNSKSYLKSPQLAQTLKTQILNHKHMSKMMMRYRKPPLALRSPVRLRSRRPPAQSTGVTNNLQTPSGSYTTSRLPKPSSEVEEPELPLNTKQYLVN